MRVMVSGYWWGVMRFFSEWVIRKDGRRITGGMHS